MIIDYEVIEAHVRKARLERSVYLGEIIANGITALAAGLNRLVAPILRRGRTIAERA